MQCPKCAADAITHHPRSGPVQYYCESCGWGMDRVFDDAEASAGVSSGTYLKLGLFWLMTLIILIGPFFGLLWAADQTLVDLPGGLSGLDERFVDGLYRHYWWVMLVYLAVCWTFTPSFDRENMGIFGAGYHGNPAVTREHHANRLLYSLHTWLVPGKIVLATVAATWQLLRGRRRHRDDRV